MLIRIFVQGCLDFWLVWLYWFKRSHYDLFFYCCF